MEQDEQEQDFHAEVKVRLRVQAVENDHVCVLQDVTSLGGDVLRFSENEAHHVVVSFRRHGENIKRPRSAKRDEIVYSTLPRNPLSITIFKKSGNTVSKPSWMA